MAPAAPRRRFDLAVPLSFGALVLVLATIALLVLDLRERRRLERHLRFADAEDEERFLEEAATYAAIRKRVLEGYVEPVEPRELLLDALDGGVRALDPHSRLIRPEDQAAVEEQARGEYHGIGVRIDRAEPALTVLYPLEGSPADLAGLRPGDRIVRIDEEELGPADHQHGVEVLKGRGNTRVLLRVVNAEDPEARARVVEAWRQPVPEPSVRHPRSLRAGRVGYVALTAFTPQTKLELIRALEQLALAGAKSFVLDLRQNGGGSYDAAIACARLFVPAGTIVSERRRGVDTEVVRANPAEARFAGTPLALLVDRATASAAEILAGALQDHGLAVLLGERTYGKGVVQSTEQLPPLIEGLTLGLRLTTEYYFTPLGRNFESRGAGTHGGGLLPDLLVPSDEREIARVRAWMDDLDIPEKHRAGVERMVARTGRAALDERILEEDQLILAALDLLDTSTAVALRLP
ncbi:MAG: S41 family peptidase, partial [Planctomycetes bacterium]|nr:S41 family peptidase [Planctomycetota bacterium]